MPIVPIEVAHWRVERIGGRWVGNGAHEVEARLPPPAPPARIPLAEGGSGEEEVAILKVLVVVIARTIAGVLVSDAAREDDAAPHAVVQERVGVAPIQPRLKRAHKLRLVGGSEVALGHLVRHQHQPRVARERLARPVWICRCRYWSVAIGVQRSDHRAALGGIHATRRAKADARESLGEHPRLSNDRNHAALERRVRQISGR